MRQLRVCIDARMETGLLGGVEQVVIGLADAAVPARRRAGGVPLPDHLRQGRVAPAIYAGTVPDHECRATHRPGPSVRYKLRDLLSRRLPFISRPAAPPSGPDHVMVSDGTVEQADVDVVHFPYQMAFLTRIPSIYHPHDLQHLHLPELFPVRDVELREALVPRVLRTGGAGGDDDRVGPARPARPL